MFKIIFFLTYFCLINCDRQNFYLDSKNSDDSYLSSLPISYPDPNLYKGDNNGFNSIDQFNTEFNGEQPLFPYVPEQSIGLAIENIDPNSNSNLQFCYDKLGRAQICVPPFENAAYQKIITATNTCGETNVTRFCTQTGTPGQEDQKPCDYCYPNQHRAEMMNDFHTNNNTMTWWQSETMKEGIRYPNPVNITLDLGKAFDITYIRLRFHSPKPESFAIFKKTNQDSDWIPFQYYSGTCQSTYDVPELTEASSEDETKALCTSEFSDISPLTGGNVIFRTLDGRPSAKDILRSPELRDFVTATNIRIMLTRQNTFGDEVFGDDDVLRSYWYAIDDLIIGGRCKCNGHASECIKQEGQSDKLICRCEHNTTGVNCESCADFFNDAPWAIATLDDANECKPCNCNGRAIKCVFDQELYDRTGHGGRCVDCIDNTAGPHCEMCKDHHYQTIDGRCVACNCDSIGSINLQCNNDGTCLCKPGVGGAKCNACLPNYYDFSLQGCRSCNCNKAGSLNNTESCDPVNGQCQCKENVDPIQGGQCTNCKLGYFDLQLENEQGCLPCFCYGHSSNCQSTPAYTASTIESYFLQDSENWRAVTRSNDLLSNVGYNEYPNYLSNYYLTNGSSKHELQIDLNNELVFVQSDGSESVYFSAPENYLGDQRYSYNQLLTFDLKINQNEPRATHEDIILSGNNLTISQPIFGQNNPLPNKELQTYRFRLLEDINYGWTPKLTAHQFITLLANLTSIKIRATYTYKGIGYLDNVRLETAKIPTDGVRDTQIMAHWVETCSCPEGYEGQFCQACSFNYRHEPRYGGPFSKCVKCECNNHAEYCDAETGKCQCQHNTGGDSCEVCAPGYYGNALKGTPEDCKPCPCPDGGACVVLPNEEVACLNCPAGYAGLRCDLCIDGHFGNPQGKNGPKTECKTCNCNDNVDPNAIGNCNTTTGECLKCIYNTYGFNCDKCLQGYFGDPLRLPKGDCKPCECHVKGTIQSQYQKIGKNFETALMCDQNSGQCNCKSYVYGRQCGQCMPDYYNISNPDGCLACNCDLIGSYNRTCDQTTGQCFCRPGVTGLKCNECKPFHYGFSLKGCQPCNCDPIGMINPQCDETGQCPCREHIEGKKCNRCRENKYNKEMGCLDCPACYGLIQDQVITHRRRLGELTELLDDIERNPDQSQDAQFDTQLKKVVSIVDDLLNRTRSSLGERKNLVNDYAQLKDSLNKIGEQQIELMFMPNLTKNVELVKNNITYAEVFIQKSKKLLTDARKLLEEEGRAALEDAKERTSSEYGQQSHKMGEMAREARLQSEKNQKMADEINYIVSQVQNTSLNAEKLMNETHKVQAENQQAVEKLRNQFKEAHATLEKTLRMAEDAKLHASKAYNSSLDIRAKAGLVPVTQLDSNQAKQSANEVQTESSRIIDQVDTILKRYTNALNQSETKLEDARKLLGEANIQQNLLSNLQNTANISLQQGKQALTLSQVTLDDAKKTLETLMSFNEQIERSKSEAEKSLEKLPLIKAKIEEVEQRTMDMGSQLSAELKLAEEAKNVAQGAQQSAQQSLVHALTMVEKANQRKKESEEIDKKVNELAEKVEDTAKDIEESERQTVKDSELAKLVLEKANQARTKANETSKRINDMLTTLEKILNDLENLDEFDVQKFKEMEMKLRVAEEEIVKADIDTRISNIKLSREDQKSWLIKYDKEILRLNKDVDNIRQIKEAIPTICYRDNTLEP